MKSGDPKIANKQSAWTTKNAPWNLPVQRYKVEATQMSPANKPAANVSGAEIAKQQAYHSDLRGLTGSTTINDVRGG